MFDLRAKQELNRGFSDALGDMAYVVEKGLKAGDLVAVSSMQALRDGMPVKVKTTPRAEVKPGAEALGNAPKADDTGGGARAGASR